MTSGSRKQTRRKQEKTGTWLIEGPFEGPSSYRPPEGAVADFRLLSTFVLSSAQTIVANGIIGSKFLEHAHRRGYAPVFVGVQLGSSGIGGRNARKKSKEV